MIHKTQLLSPADGNVVQTLTDPRILATAGGVLAGNYGEKAIWKAARKTFGYAVPGQDGRAVYYGQKADGTQDSTPNPRLGMNRQLARGALVVGAVAAIEYIDSGEAQYLLLGAASLWLTHIAQDALPILNGS